MITVKTAILTAACALLFAATPSLNAETPAQLRARYLAASAEQRTAILQELHKQRQSERLARFGEEREGELTREEWPAAAKAEREAWQTFQTERDRQIRAANEQHQLSRNAALRQRREVYSSADLSQAEKAAILETIRQEQKAHRASRQ